MNYLISGINHETGIRMHNQNLLREEFLTYSLFIKTFDGQWYKGATTDDFSEALKIRDDLYGQGAKNIVILKFVEWEAKEV